MKLVFETPTIDILMLQANEIIVTSGPADNEVLDNETLPEGAGDNKPGIIFPGL